MKQRLHGGVRARQRRRVGRGRPSSCAGRSALERQDRLAARDATGDPAEPPRVPEGLEVHDHDGGALVVFPVLQEVVRRDVRLVSDGDERREPEAAGGGLVEQREAERSALRAEGDVAGRKLGRGERAVERGVGERDPHAIRPEQPRAVGADERKQLGLARLSFGAKLGEARGDHADRAGPVPKRRLDDAEHRRPGDADEREVDGPGQLGEVRVSALAVHGGALAIDGVERAGKARGPDVAEERPADRARPGRRADHGDARRREERPQRLGDGDVVPLVPALEVGRRLRQV